VLSLTVKSRAETFTVGTLKAMPVSFPLSEGITLPTALAAPVVEGIMFTEAALPALQSLPPLAGPSTGIWLIVMAWTVVMRPSAIPKLSLMTLATGAKQLVVHDAIDMNYKSFLYSVWFTPITYMGVSSLGGELITIFFPPMLICACAFSLVR
jgi:hypothetical protein